MAQPRTIVQTLQERLKTDDDGDLVVEDANRLTRIFASEIELAADTADSASIAEDVTHVVLSTDQAVYVAKTAAALDTVAAGAEGARVYLPAGTTGFELPWSGQDIYAKPAVAGEGATLHVIALK